MPKRDRELSLADKKIALFLDFQFEDMEAMYPKLRLEEEGATVHVIGAHPSGTKYTGKYGYPLKSDKSADEVSADDYAALVVPGGFAPDYFRRSAKMCAITSAMLAQGKPIAAICHGPWMLCSARREDGTPAIKGHRATSFIAVKDDVLNAGAEWVDEAVVVSERSEPTREVVITSRTPNDLTPWVHAIMDALVG